MRVHAGRLINMIETREGGQIICFFFQLLQKQAIYFSFEMLIF